MKADENYSLMMMIIMFAVQVNNHFRVKESFLLFLLELPFEHLKIFVVLPLAVHPVFLRYVFLPYLFLLMKPCFYHSKDWRDSNQVTRVHALQKAAQIGI